MAGYGEGEEGAGEEAGDSAVACVSACACAWAAAVAYAEAAEAAAADALEDLELEEGWEEEEAVVWIYLVENTLFSLLMHRTQKKSIFFSARLTKK